MAVDEMVVKWSMDSSNFNAGLTKLNKSMSMLQSEFKTSSTKLANFGSETDKLKNKADFLNKSIDIQKAKIDALSKSYEKSKSETGANSEATQNAAIKLNNAIGYYNTLEGKLKTTNSELEKQNSKWNKVSKSLDSIGSKMTSLGSKLSTFGKNLSIGVTVPIIAAGTASFELASDMDESMNKVDVAFGANADGIKRWSDTTLKNFGIAKGSSLDMAAQFGDMATGMGISSGEASTMSQTLVGLGGDLSSFKNINLDVAKTALTSIFTGETESLKGLGIVMTQTNLNEFAMKEGMGKTVDQMTQAEQVQLRYAYVMDKTKNAQGDFARTSDGAANQQRIFTESLKELGATFGQNILPIVTPVITKLNELMQKFSGLDQGTQKSILKFGIFAAAVGPATTVLGKFTSGIGNTLKFVANLDKNFGKLKTTLGAAGTNLKKVGTFMLQGAKSAGTLALNVGKSAVAFGKQAAQSAASVIKLIAHKVATIATTIATKALQLAQMALNFVMSLNPITLIIIGIGLLVGAIILLWNKCDWFRNGVTDVFNWISEKFKMFDDFLTNVFTTDWTNSFGVFGNLLNGLFKTVGDVWNSIKQIFGGIIDFVAGVFTGDWSRAWEGVKNIFGGIMSGLGAVMKAPLNAVIGLINMAIDGLNSISFTAPEWVPGVGGKHFGVNLNHINYLYNGGIIDRPTNIGNNTVVGDSYKGMGRQREAVVPLDSMYRNLRNIVKEENSSQSIILYTTNITTLNGKEIARETKKEVIKDITREQNSRSKGKGLGVSYA